MAFSLPSHSWNTHVHCFDSKAFPFKANRDYTPQPAPLEALLENVLAERIMIVQASIEGSHDGLLAQLCRCHEGRPNKMVRGTVFADPEGCLTALASHEFDMMHDLGVRSIRIHGSYGGQGCNIDWVKSQFQQVAQLYPVQAYGWSISAQLPLQVWASISAFIRHHPDLQNISIVADHNGGANPSDFGSPEMDDFLDLLRSGKVFVKISALHRRSPEDFHLMKPIIKSFAKVAPFSIMWGSDWPHVDTSKKGLEVSGPLRGIDTGLELRAIHSWLSEEQWLGMLVTNPERLFGG